MEVFEYADKYASVPLKTKAVWLVYKLFSMGCVSYYFIIEYFRQFSLENGKIFIKQPGGEFTAWQKFEIIIIK